MDPEAGTHGSGGRDPWIRASEAGLGRPAGGMGPEVQKERKRVKSSRKCSHLTYPRPDPLKVFVHMNAPQLLGCACHASEAIHGSRGSDPWIRRLGCMDPGGRAGGGWDPWIQRPGSTDPEAGTHGSGGWDPWIRRLGSVDPEAGIMDPEARIHGSGGWDPWIRRLGSTDPEAGIHGSGGWDPWIRRLGSMDPSLRSRPRPAEAGRPGGGGQKCKKSEKE